MNIPRLIKNDLFIVFSLTLFALLSRLYGLGQWEFMVDEYYTVYDAEDRYHSLKTNPIYYALALFMFKFFGVSEWSARFPAFLLGVATIPAVYLLCRNWFDRHVALFAALIILFSSWHLWYSQFSRFYSGVFLFGFLSYFYYYKAVESGRISYLVITFLMNIIAVLLHQSAVLVIGSCVFWSILILLFPQKLGVTIIHRKIAWIYTGSYTLIGLMAITYLIERAVSWFDKGQAWGYGSFSFVLQLVKYVQIPIFVAAFVGLVLMIQRERNKGVFFLVAVGTPFIVMVTASSIMSVRPDYLFYAIPLIYILSAYFCDYVRKLFTNNQLASYGVILLLVASMLPETVSHYTGKKTQGFREVVAYVENEFKQGDRILPFVSGFNHYASRPYKLEQRLGSPYENKHWDELLKQYGSQEHKVFILLPRQRKPLDKKLESWLLNNARLAWRHYENRIDFTVRGYQVFVTGGDQR